MLAKTSRSSRVLAKLRGGGAQHEAVDAVGVAVPDQLGDRARPSSSRPG